MQVTVEGRLLDAAVKGLKGSVFGAVAQGAYVRPFYAKVEGGAAEVLAAFQMGGGDLPLVQLTGTVFADSDFETKVPNGKLVFAVQSCSVVPS